MKITSETFCPLPFCHINIKSNGKVSLCWRSAKKIGDYSTSSLIEIWNNNNIKAVRKKLLTGEIPIECKSCLDFEKSNINSTRNQVIQSKKYIAFNDVIKNIKEDFSLKTDNITIMELRFSSLCNLMCKHCGPLYSSRWKDAAIKNTKLQKILCTKIPNNTKDNEISIKNIEEICKFRNIKEFMIAGVNH